MSATTKKRVYGVVAPEKVRRALSALVNRVGPAEAARQVGIASQTLSRFLAALPVQENGLFAVAARLGVSLAGVVPVEGDVPVEETAETASTSVNTAEPGEATRP